MSSIEVTDTENKKITIDLAEVILFGDGEGLADMELANAVVQFKNNSYLPIRESLEDIGMLLMKSKGLK